MNIFDALKKHHKEMLDMFEAVEKDPARYPDLHKHLMVHHALEGGILYSEMQKKDKHAWWEATEMLEEHHVLDYILLDLENFPRDHERWAVKFHVLEEYVEHHFGEEEAKVFEEGKKVIDTAEALSMAKDYETRKDEYLKCGD
jgi:hypothetical protein